MPSTDPISVNATIGGAEIKVKISDASQRALNDPNARLVYTVEFAPRAVSDRVDD